MSDLSASKGSALTEKLPRIKAKTKIIEMTEIFFIPLSTPCKINILQSLDWMTV